MTRQFLSEQIQQKKSFLCIGLDADITKIPTYLRAHPEAIFEFNKQLIDATKDLCVSYKINTAFYEALGLKGWEALEKTIHYIPQEHFTIADAKRGDIGNTSAQYAKAFFETLPFDAVTVAPYMGEDSVKPFLTYKDKWAIVLGLTSNAGSKDFEQQKIGDEFLYETVLRKVSEWGNPDNLMFVIGATKAKELEHIRTLIPDHFLLVPGVGSQGGNLGEVARYGRIKDTGMLVNVSRAIIYASNQNDFATAARTIALQYQAEMATVLSTSL